MNSYGNTYIDNEEMLQGEQLGDGLENGVAQGQGRNAPPVVDEEELLAAQAAAEAAAAQGQGPGGAFSNVGQGLTGEFREVMMQYWQETINSIEHDEHDFKNHQLPLARIKKVMKTDEDVKMISAEAPILFAKGCDVFITELTMRAWIHAEENKRRTLQKSDIAAALTKSDMFDFLIDVVPREEEKLKKYNQRSYQQPYDTHQQQHQQQYQHQNQQQTQHQQPQHQTQPQDQSQQTQQTTQSSQNQSYPPPEVKSEDYNRDMLHMQQSLNQAKPGSDNYQQYNQYNRFGDDINNQYP